ncbi:Conserved_hypothetical protein [Hexamita inflata]|uniref:Uncharacterized protein n=1 Tax=Hexamita inflata TaxID=28002 RepID=A0ABP1HFW0_9EUKA
MTKQSSNKVQLDNTLSMDMQLEFAPLKLPGFVSQKVDNSNSSDFTQTKAIPVFDTQVNANLSDHQPDFPKNIGPGTGELSFTRTLQQFESFNPNDEMRQQLRQLEANQQNEVKEAQQRADALNQQSQLKNRTVNVVKYKPEDSYKHYIDNIVSKQHEFDRAEQSPPKPQIQIEQPKQQEVSKQQNNRYVPSTDILSPTPQIQFNTPVYQKQYLPHDDLLTISEYQRADPIKQMYADRITTIQPLPQNQVVKSTTSQIQPKIHRAISNPKPQPQPALEYKTLPIPFQNDKIIEQTALNKVKLMEPVQIQDTLRVQTSVLAPEWSSVKKQVKQNPVQIEQNVIRAKTPVEGVYIDNAVVGFQKEQETKQNNQFKTVKESSDVVINNGVLVYQENSQNTPQLFTVPHKAVEESHAIDNAMQEIDKSLANLRKRQQNIIQPAVRQQLIESEVQAEINQGQKMQVKKEEFQLLSPQRNVIFNEEQQVLSPQKKVLIDKNQARTLQTQHLQTKKQENTSMVETLTTLQQPKFVTETPNTIYTNIQKQYGEEFKPNKVTRQVVNNEAVTENQVIKQGAEPQKEPNQDFTQKVIEHNQNNIQEHKNFIKNMNNQSQYEQNDVVIQKNQVQYDNELKVQHYISGGSNQPEINTTIRENVKQSTSPQRFSPTRKADKQNIQEHGVQKSMKVVEDAEIHNAFEIAQNPMFQTDENKVIKTVQPNIFDFTQSNLERQVSPKHQQIKEQVSNAINVPKPKVNQLVEQNQEIYYTSPKKQIDQVNNVVKQKQNIQEDNIQEQSVIINTIPNDYVDQKQLQTQKQRIQKEQNQTSLQVQNNNIINKDQFDIANVYEIKSAKRKQTDIAVSEVTKITKNQVDENKDFQQTVIRQKINNTANDQNEYTTNNQFRNQQSKRIDQLKYNQQQQNQQGQIIINEQEIDLTLPEENDGEPQYFDNQQYTENTKKQQVTNTRQQIISNNYKSKGENHQQNIPNYEDEDEQFIEEFEQEVQQAIKNVIPVNENSASVDQLDIKVDKKKLNQAQRIQNDKVNNNFVKNQQDSSSPEYLIQQTTKQVTRSQNVDDSQVDFAAKITKQNKLQQDISSQQVHRYRKQAENPTYEINNPVYLPIAAEEEIYSEQLKVKQTKKQPAELQIGAQKQFNFPKMQNQDAPVREQTPVKQLIIVDEEVSVEQNNAFIQRIKQKEQHIQGSIAQRHGRTPNEENILVNDITRTREKGEQLEISNLSPTKQGFKQIQQEDVHIENVQKMIYNEEFDEEVYQQLSPNQQKKYIEEIQDKQANASRQKITGQKQKFNELQTISVKPNTQHQNQDKINSQFNTENIMLESMEEDRISPQKKKNVKTDMINDVEISQIIMERSDVLQNQARKSQYAKLKDEQYLQSSQFKTSDKIIPTQQEYEQIDSRLQREYGNNYQILSPSIKKRVIEQQYQVQSPDKVSPQKVESLEQILYQVELQKRKEKEQLFDIQQPQSTKSQQQKEILQLNPKMKKIEKDYEITNTFQEENTTKKRSVQQKESMNVVVPQNQLVDNDYLENSMENIQEEQVEKVVSIKAPKRQNQVKQQNQQLETNASPIENIGNRIDNAPILGEQVDFTRIQVQKQELPINMEIQTVRRKGGKQQLQEYDIESDFNMTVQKQLDKSNVLQQIPKKQEIQIETELNTQFQRKKNVNDENIKIDNLQKQKESKINNVQINIQSQKHGKKNQLDFDDTIEYLNVNNESHTKQKDVDTNIDEQYIMSQISKQYKKHSDSQDYQIQQNNVNKQLQSKQDSQIENIYNQKIQKQQLNNKLNEDYEDYEIVHPKTQFKVQEDQQISQQIPQNSQQKANYYNVNQNNVSQTKQQRLEQQEQEIINNKIQRRNYSNLSASGIQQQTTQIYDATIETSAPINKVIQSQVKLQKQGLQESSNQDIFVNEVFTNKAKPSKQVDASQLNVKQNKNNQLVILDEEISVEQLDARQTVNKQQVVYNNNIRKEQIRNKSTDQNSAAIRSQFISNQANSQQQNEELQIQQNQQFNRETINVKNQPGIQQQSIQTDNKRTDDQFIQTAVQNTGTQQLKEVLKDNINLNIENKNVENIISNKNIQNTVEKNIKNITESNVENTSANKTVENIFDSINENITQKNIKINNELLNPTQQRHLNNIPMEPITQQTEQNKKKLVQNLNISEQSSITEFEAEIDNLIVYQNNQLQKGEDKIPIQSVKQTKQQNKLELDDIYNARQIMKNKHESYSDYEQMNEFNKHKAQNENSFSEQQTVDVQREAKIKENNSPEMDYHFAKNQGYDQLTNSDTDNVANTQQIRRTKQQKQIEQTLEESLIFMDIHTELLAKQDEQPHVVSQHAAKNVKTNQKLTLQPKIQESFVKKDMKEAKVLDDSVNLNDVVMKKPTQQLDNDIQFANVKNGQKFDNRRDDADEVQVLKLDKKFQQKQQQLEDEYQQGHIKQTKLVENQLEQLNCQRDAIKQQDFDLDIDELAPQSKLPNAREQYDAQDARLFKKKVQPVNQTTAGKVSIKESQILVQTTNKYTKKQNLSDDVDAQGVKIVRQLQESDIDVGTLDAITKNRQVEIEHSIINLANNNPKPEEMDYDTLNVRQNLPIDDDFTINMTTQKLRKQPQYREQLVKSPKTKGPNFNSTEEQLIQPVIPNPQSLPKSQKNEQKTIKVDADFISFTESQDNQQVRTFNVKGEHFEDSIEDLHSSEISIGNLTEFARSMQSTLPNATLKQQRTHEEELKTPILEATTKSAPKYESDVQLLEIQRENIKPKAKEIEINKPSVEITKQKIDKPSIDNKSAEPIQKEEKKELFDSWAQTEVKMDVIDLPVEIPLEQKQKKEPKQKPKVSFEKVEEKPKIQEEKQVKEEVIELKPKIIDSNLEVSRFEEPDVQFGESNILNKTKTVEPSMVHQAKKQLINQPADYVHGGKYQSVKEESMTSPIRRSQVKDEENYQRFQTETINDDKYQIKQSKFTNIEAEEIKQQIPTIYKKVDTQNAQMKHKFTTEQVEDDGLIKTAKYNELQLSNQFDQQVAPAPKKAQVAVQKPVVSDSDLMSYQFAEDIAKRHQKEELVESNVEIVDQFEREIMRGQPKRVQRNQEAKQSIESSESDTSSVQSYSSSSSDSPSYHEPNQEQKKITSDFNALTEMLKNYPFFTTVYEVCDKCKYKQKLKQQFEPEMKKEEQKQPQKQEKVVIPEYVPEEFEAIELKPKQNPVQKVKKIEESFVQVEENVVIPVKFNQKETIEENKEFALKYAQNKTKIQTVNLPVRGTGQIIKQQILTKLPPKPQRENIHQINTFDVKKEPKEVIIKDAENVRRNSETSYEGPEVQKPMFTKYTVAKPKQTVKEMQTSFSDILKAIGVADEPKAEVKQESQISQSLSSEEQYQNILTVVLKQQPQPKKQQQYVEEQTSEYSMEQSDQVIRQVQHLQKPAQQLKEYITLSHAESIDEPKQQPKVQPQPQKSIYSNQNQQQEHLSFSAIQPKSQIDSIISEAPAQNKKNLTDSELIESGEVYPKVHKRIINEEYLNVGSLSEGQAVSFGSIAKGSGSEETGEYDLQKILKLLGV